MTERVISNEPDGAPRIATLDILRGVAILGILFMNINDMGGPITFGDIRHLGWSGADQIAWWLREVFADGTARCLLQFLFGAGMVILTERIAPGASAWTVMRRYYWRNLVLLAFGLVHMYVLLWPGDILHTYGIAAMLVFLVRRLPSKWLILLALIGPLSQAVVVGGSAVSAARTHAAAAAVDAKQAAGTPLTVADRAVLKARQERHTKRARDRAEIARDVAREDADRSSTAGRWIASAWKTSSDRLANGELFAVWEAAGAMLVGIVLFRLGILQGARRRAFYGWMLLIGYGLAGGYRLFGAYEATRFDDRVQWRWMLYEAARMGMTLGHVAAICLALGTVVGARLLQPFAAAGRTALSIYVVQSIVCLWLIFPPWGLALYGTLGWMPLMLLSVAIDAALLWLAVVYLRRYRNAPVEWAWRSIVEGRALAFRR